MNISQLKSVVVSLAKILNAVSSFAHKGGLLALYPIIGEAQSLVKMDWDMVLMQLLSLSTEEGNEVELAFNSELKLQNPNVQIKIQEAINLVQDGALVVHDGISLFQKAKALVEKAKLLVSAPKAA